MPFTAWKHTERNRQRDRKKYVMISGGFVIPHTPPNSEIICGQNVGTKVVCGIIFFFEKRAILKI